MTPAARSLPAFTPDGVLPPGDCPMTLNQLAVSMLVSGPSDPAACPEWDAPWRAELVRRLGVVCEQLWAVGITGIFVDGSFAEDKDHSNDIDGYFVCDLHELASGELERRLNLLDPDKVWTWDPASRRPYRGYDKKQLPMWHKHRVEMYPHVGQLTGIRDEHGQDQEFSAAFRKSRNNGKPKGIIRIERGDAS